MATTLQQNSAARGAARKAGVAIVNAKPATSAPAPVKAAPKPTVLQPGQSYAITPGVNVPGVNVDVSRLTYNNRRAEANVVTQNASAVLSKVQAREAMLQRQRQDLLADFNSGAIDQEEFNARATLITQGALRDAGVRDLQANNLLDASSILSGIGGQTVDLNTRTIAKNGGGAPAGEIERKAIARLVADKGLTPEQAKQEYDASKPSIAATASNTGAGGSFDQNQNYIPPTNVNHLMTSLSPADRATAKQLLADIESIGASPEANISKIGLEETQWQERVAQAYQLREAKQNQLNELLNRSKKSQQNNMPVVPGAAPGTTAPTDMVTPKTQQGDTPPGTDPNSNLPPPAPIIDPKTGQPNLDALTPEDPLANVESRAQQSLQERLAISDSNPLDVGADKQAAEETIAAQLDAADAAEKVAKERALEKERADLAINDRARALASVENAKSLLDQIKLNEENEVKNRRRVSKLSGGADMRGMEFLQKNVQDGLDTLNYLRTKISTLEGQFGDKAISIVNDYYNDLNSAEADKKKLYADAYESYSKALKDIRNDLRLDSATRRKEKEDAHKDYADTLTKLDFKRGDYMNQLRLKAVDRMTGLEKLRLQTENAQVGRAIQMLALATKKGVQMSPEAMASFEKQIAPDLPPGWMKFSVAGSGGTGSNYKHWTPEGLEAARTWISAQPGRSMTQLSPSDQEWLVPINTSAAQTATGASTGTYGSGGTPNPSSKPAPANPFSFEQPKDASIPGMIKEYDTLVERDPSLKGAFSLTDYVNLKTYGMLYGLNPELRQRVQAAAGDSPIGVPSENDTTIDDIINSDSYDLYAE